MEAPQLRASATGKWWRDVTIAGETLNQRGIRGGGSPLPIVWWDSSQGHSTGTSEGSWRDPTPAAHSSLLPSVDPSLSSPPHPPHRHSCFLNDTSQHRACEFFGVGPRAGQVLMALALIRAAADFLGRTGSMRTEDNILTLEGQAEEDEEVSPQTHKGTNHLRANTNNQILRRKPSSVFSSSSFLLVPYPLRGCEGIVVCRCFQIPGIGFSGVLLLRPYWFATQRDCCEH